MTKEIVQTGPFSCAICRDLDPSLFDVYEPRPPFVWINWNDIQATTKDCVCCAALADILSQFFTKSGTSPRRAYLLYKKTLCLRIEPDFELIVYSTRKTPWSSIITQDHIVGPTSSDASLNFVKDLLRECSDQHGLCRMQVAAHLPTRLLDVGDRNKTCDDDTIKLWETGETKPSHATRYLCLSHCWGRDQPIKTTAQTIEEHKKRIRLSDLPRMFAEAVDFTRRLGVRYLWIDSLCIIQGDTEDWKKEAARMSDVYRNCILCLGAPGSSGNSNGFYSNRPIHQFSSSPGSTRSHEGKRLALNCGIRVRAKSSLGSDDQISHTGESNVHQPWTIFARERLEHWPLIEPHWCSYVSKHHDHQTLRFRAWVFQERMLAPRFLHFLQQELAWDCQTSSACECGYENDDIGDRSLGHSKHEFVSELQSASTNSIAFMWRSIVSDYTELYLTYEKDRLAAIEGIARVFKEKRGPNSHYHAGMWSDTLEQDLCWGIGFLEKTRKADGTDWKLTEDTWGNESERSISRVEGVPSWSWASVSRRINFILEGGEYFESLCTVREIGEPEPVEVADNSVAFKQILEIEGFLVSAKLLYMKEKGDFKKMFNLQFHDEEETRIFAYDDHLDLPGTSHVKPGETVYYLLLGKYDVTSDSNIHSTHLDPSSWTYCSIILKTIDQSKNLYRRIGSVTSPWSSFAGKLTKKTVVRIC